MLTQEEIEQILATLSIILVDSMVKRANCSLLIQYGIIQERFYLQDYISRDDLTEKGQRLAKAIESLIKDFEQP